MALNLWAAGGKPTSYNPLPTNWVVFVSLPKGPFIVTFRAKSASSASLSVADRAATGGTDFNKLITLTPEFKTYSEEFTLSIPDDLFINSNSANTVHDIIIEDIKIIHKPLSVIRTLPAQLRAKNNIVPTDVNGWEQGTINATVGYVYPESKQINSTRIRLVSLAKALPSTPYSIQVASGYEFHIVWLDSTNTVAGSGGWFNRVTVTSHSNTVSLMLIVRKVGESIILPSEILEAKPQIETGPVVTSFEPYQVGNKTNLRTGLEFDGLTNYLTMPGVVFDEAEIEFIPFAYDTNMLSTLFALGLQTNTNPFYWIYYDKTGNITAQAKGVSTYTSKLLGTLIRFNEINKVSLIHSNDGIAYEVNDVLVSWNDPSLTKVVNPSSLGLMAYASSMHLTKGNLLSFKAWNKGAEVLNKDFTSKEPHGFTSYGNPKRRSDISRTLQAIR